MAANNINGDITSCVHNFVDDTDNQFHFSHWRHNGGFECARAPAREYIMLCKSDMILLADHWERSIKSVEQCASPSLAIAVILMAMQAAVICGLLIYILVG